LFFPIEMIHSHFHQRICETHKISYFLFIAHHALVAARPLVNIDCEIDYEPSLIVYQHYPS
jgi:hypothetical protein